MKMSLRSKTIAGIAVIEAALLILLVVTAINFMRSRINEDLVRFASTTATLFATTTKDAVLSYDLASLDAFVSEVLKNPSITYARVRGPDGAVFSEGGDPVQRARPFSEDLTVASVDDDSFDTSADIAESGTVYGRVEIGVTVAGLQQSIAKIQNWTSTIAMVEMALVAVFSFVLGTYLTRQLLSLRRGARSITDAISTGHYADIHVPVQGDDELTEVARAFNTLASSLAEEHQRRTEYEESLQALNQSLETKVEKRTQMLAQRNDELKATNQELQDTQQQLVHSEKMASVGQLAAGVAHEINNPVGFVTSNLNTLVEYTAAYQQLAGDLVAYFAATSDEERQPLAERMQALMESEDITFVNEDSKQLLEESIDGLVRVKGIVQGLKQFSRADVDETQYFDLNQCVETALKMVNSELKYNRTVNVDLQELPPVPVNVGKITQVITNLLMNASQAISGEGTVSVTSRSLGDRVEIAVADTGSGIAPEHREKLFDPFFTTKPVGEGTGLGLSVSYGIMNEHGGKIEVSSEPGSGSCFTLIFPLEASRQTA